MRDFVISAFMQPDNRISPQADQYFALYVVIIGALMLISRTFSKKSQVVIVVIMIAIAVHKFGLITNEMAVSFIEWLAR